MWREPPTMRKMSRRDPLAPLSPRCVWSTTSDGFIGDVVIGEHFSFDGRDEDGEGINFSATPYHKPFAVLDGGYEIRAAVDWDPATMLLFEPAGEQVGYYAGGMLWIDPDHRGRGLASELVLALADALDTSPVRHHGGLGYSRDGHSAHLRAWLVGTRRAIEAGREVSGPVLADATYVEHRLGVERMRRPIEAAAPAP